MTTTTYLTVAELKDYLGIDRDEQVSNLADAIASATRDVNSFTGRRFYADVDGDGDPVATVRTFHPVSCYVADVADFYTTTDLVVKTDDDDDGTYETVWSAGTDFELEYADGIGPNGESGWPYWRIVAVGTKTFPQLRRRSLQVTAAWGWAAVPADVTQACRLLATNTFKRKDAPFGVAGYGVDGLLIRVREDPKVEELLSVYRTMAARSGLLVA